MNSLIHFRILVVLVFAIGSLVSSTPAPVVTTENDRISTNVNIYSNLAEIIQPLTKLPLEFSKQDWSNIRPDSITLLGSNTNVTQITITEKTQSLNNQSIYVRSPTSTSTNKKYLKAIMIDENRRLVKLIDEDISKEPTYFTVLSNDILYVNEPPESKYYVNFAYDTKDKVYVSYLRSNLNWKTRYELHLYEGTQSPVLIAMADIRNNGDSRVDIEHGELLGGDINLQMSAQTRPVFETSRFANLASADYKQSSSDSPPSARDGKEVAGLYVFPIDQPFSIDGKTNFLLPMFRPQVTVDRYASINLKFNHQINSNGKAERRYCLSSDRFLSSGNCMIREDDHLVGETFFPDVAAKDEHTFSLGEDSDIIYRRNVSLVSKHTYNETIGADNTVQKRTKSIYTVKIVLKNYKENHTVKVKFEERIYGRWIKLVASESGVMQDGKNMKHETTLLPGEEKVLQYKVDITN